MWVQGLPVRVNICIYIYIDSDIDIYVNCNWVDTRWQWHSTQLHTDIHRTTQLTTLVGKLSGIRNQSGQTKINVELTAYIRI